MNPEIFELNLDRIEMSGQSAFHKMKNSFRCAVSDLELK